VTGSKRIGGRTYVNKDEPEVVLVTFSRSEPRWDVPPGRLGPMPIATSPPRDTVTDYTRTAVPYPNQHPAFPQL